jgi:fluoride exporter
VRGVESWYQVVVLSVGGVLGVNARYWLGLAITRWVGAQFPWATFTINVSGSFAIGLFTVFLARWLPQHPHARLLVVVGFLGGYTTFSSFSFESMTLWERGEPALCLTYLIGSVVAGFAAVLVGTALGRGLVYPVADRAASGDRGLSGTVRGARISPSRDRAEPVPKGAVSPPKDDRGRFDPSLPVIKEPETST